VVVMAAVIVVVTVADVIADAAVTVVDVIAAGVADAPATGDEPTPSRETTRARFARQTLPFSFAWCKAIRVTTPDRHDPFGVSR